MEDKVHSIKAILGRIITRQFTTCVGPEHERHIQEVAKLTQEARDFDAIREDTIQKPQLDALRARLNKITHWVSESSNNMHAWNMGKLTRLRTEDSTTPPSRTQE